MDPGARSLTAGSAHRLLAGLVAAACLASAAAGWWNSATNDEPYFTLGAYAAVAGEGLWVVEHPPLYKLAAGIPLHVLPLKPPAHPDAVAFSRLPAVIHAFLQQNHVPALTILRVARLGMLVFLVLLLWGVFRLGEVVAGPEVGLAAAFALACQPLVLGHAFVVHTDVPAAACWVWACVYLERFLAGQSPAWAGLGVWLGLALAAKHSGVLLLLLVVLRVLVARLHHKPVAFLRLLGALVLSWLVPFLITAWTLRHVTVGLEKMLVQLVAQKLAAWSWVRGFFSPLADWCQACCHWLLGFAFVLWNNTYGQGVNFFWGAFSTHGFALYFPVALLAKLSLPFTVFWVMALGRWRSLPEGIRWLALYALLYLAASLGSAFNIGARHLMPAVAWLSLLVGWMLSQLGSRWRATVLAALLAAPVVSFPHYISHFSLLVGGTRGGEKIFNDSNLDWGQDWARLAKLAKERGWQPLYAVYIGPDDPSGYGSPMENVLLTGRFPASGYVAVSSWAATVGPHYLAYSGFAENARYLRELLGFLQGCPVVGQVGDSIRVYRCGETPALPLAPGEPPPTPRE